MIELKRNPETGLVEAYENGKQVGEVITMGDEIIAEGEKDEKVQDGVSKL